MTLNIENALPKPVIVRRIEPHTGIDGKLV
jgi:hypothetical protein